MGGVMDLGSDLVSGLGNTLPSMNNMKEYKYSDALIKSNLSQFNSNLQFKYNFISFEGSFETEPNHQHQLFIILGNGLLLCRWSQTKQHKLKFVRFYPWNSFFSISNRPEQKTLICTFKLQNIRTNDKGNKRLPPPSSQSLSY